MKTGLILALTASLFDTADAALEFGTCKPTNNIANLDLDRYSGPWYEYQRDSSTFFEWGSTCVRTDYGSKFKNGNDVSVDNKASGLFGIQITTQDDATAR